MSNKTRTFIVLLSFIGLSAFGQTMSFTGAITKARPFNDQYAITVGDTVFVLIVDKKDTSGTRFDINQESSDLLVKKEGKYEIAPKYLNKTYKIIYMINGKGWKCIKKIETSDN